MATTALAQAVRGKPARDPVVRRPDHHHRHLARCVRRGRDDELSVRARQACARSRPGQRGGHRARRQEPCVRAGGSAGARADRARRRAAGGWCMISAMGRAAHRPDQELGLCHLRVPARAPFGLQYCCNGRSLRAGALAAARGLHTLLDLRGAIPRLHPPRRGQAARRDPGHPAPAVRAGPLDVVGRPATAPGRRRSSALRRRPAVRPASRRPAARRPGWG